MYAKGLETVKLFLFCASTEKINSLMFQVTSRYFVSKAVSITTLNRVVMRPETPASQRAGHAAQDKAPGSLSCS